MDDPDAAAEIDAGLRALHGDPAAARDLSHLHERAAALVADPKARRFHLTHAWVYAMVAGDPLAEDRLERDLKRLKGL